MRMRRSSGIGCGVAQTVCGVAQIVVRPPAVQHGLGLDFRPGTPLEIPLLSINGEDTA